MNRANPVIVAIFTLAIALAAFAFVYWTSELPSSSNCDGASLKRGDVIKHKLGARYVVVFVRGNVFGGCVVVVRDFYGNTKEIYAEEFEVTP